jgi:hypothetical protein
MRSTTTTNTTTRVVVLQQLNSILLPSHVGPGLIKEEENNFNAAATFKMRNKSMSELSAEMFQ